MSLISYFLVPHINIPVSENQNVFPIRKKIRQIELLQNILKNFLDLA
jgi:hypothetical protein